MGWPTLDTHSSKDSPSLLRGTNTGFAWKLLAACVSSTSLRERSCRATTGRERPHTHRALIDGKRRMDDGRVEASLCLGVNDSLRAPAQVVSPGRDSDRCRRPAGRGRDRALSSISPAIRMTVVCNYSRDDLDVLSRSGGRSVENAVAERWMRAGLRRSWPSTAMQNCSCAARGASCSRCSLCSALGSAAFASSRVPRSSRS